jgi:hypothetical protein
MADRDILSEALYWRDNLRPHKADLKIALYTLPDKMLEHVYVLWWDRYSKGIQSAPSNWTRGRYDLGVSEKDAIAAAEAADDAVWETIRTKENAVEHEDTPEQPARISMARSWETGTMAPTAAHWRIFLKDVPPFAEVGQSSNSYGVILLANWTEEPKEPSFWSDPTRG